MDDIKIIVALNVLLAILQIAREVLGLARDLLNKKNNDKTNGGE